MPVLRLLFLLLAIFSAAAYANGMAQADDFYQGQAPIDGRDQAAQQAATRAALGQVLARLSGNVSISMSSGAEALIADADQYVRSFRYAQLEIPGAQDQRSRQQMLLVDFDPSSLLRAARQQGLPIWDARRPTTMVWLLGPTDKGPRQLYDAARIEQKLGGLVEAARQRGLPLRYPKLDQQDQAKISAMDIVGEDYRRLEQASARYQARHILLVRIERRERLWYALWSFVQADEAPMRWRSMGEDPNIALAAGFDRYADELASRYATQVTAGWEQDAKLRVTGIRNLAGYARTLSWLESNNLVQSVTPSELIDDQVVFTLRFEGETSDLKRNLRLSGFLQEEVAPMYAPTSNSPDDASTPAGAPAGGQAQSGGLSFYAVSSRPELRYRYLD